MRVKKDSPKTPIVYQWAIEVGDGTHDLEGQWEFDEEPTEELLEEMMADERSNVIVCSYWKIESSQ